MLLTKRWRRMMAPKLQSESKTHKQHLFLSEGNNYEKREHPIQNLSE